MCGHNYVKWTPGGTSAVGHNVQNRTLSSPPSYVYSSLAELPVAQRETSVSKTQACHIFSGFLPCLLSVLVLGQLACWPRASCYFLVTERGVQYMLLTHKWEEKQESRVWFWITQKKQKQKTNVKTMYLRWSSGKILHNVFSWSLQPLLGGHCKCFVFSKQQVEKDTDYKWRQIVNAKT